MSQAQRGVGGDGAASVEDFGDAVGRDFESARRFSRAHVQLAQFLGEMFAGMDGLAWHKYILDAAVGDRGEKQIPRCVRDDKSFIDA